MERANFFWKGKLTKVELASITSFVKNGFEVNFWSYENHYIEGATSKDANLIMKDRDIEMQNEILGKTTIAAFSDLLRYKILSQEEGWWFDSDCICLKNESKFKELRETAGKNKVLVGLHVCDGKILAANGAMYLSKQIATNLAQECISILEEHNYSLPKWGMTGPTLVDRYLVENDLLHHTVPYGYFYEIGYDEVSMFYDKEKFNDSMRRIKNSYITHVWDTHLIANQIDKNNPPDGSLLDYLIKN